MRLLISKDKSYYLKESHFIVIWLSFFLNSFGQEIKSRVVNQDGEPIPYAHIYMDESMGTISNREGYFRLKTLDTERKINYLNISSIGYKPSRVSIGNVPHNIVLVEDEIMLNGVAIVPKDYAKELIEKAILAIQKNYPSVKEKHRGFLREKMYWKGLEHEPVYIAEAVLESVKEPYKHTQKKGIVSVLKYRKYESNQLDSLPVRIYGGAHHMHRFDIVASRKAFLSNPDHFDYEIKDTLRFENQNLYKVHFQKKRLNGYVYIMDSSYAITKAKFQYGSFSPLDIQNRSRDYLDFTVSYELNNETWRYKQSNYNTGFKKNGTLLHLHSEYTSTGVDPYSLDIPYTERLHFNDILLEKKQAYDSAFWKDHNIIIGDSTIESVFNNPVDNAPSKSFQSKLFQVLNRMRVSLAVDYIPVTVNAHQILFSNNEISVNESYAFENTHILKLSSAIQYEWKESFFIGLNTTMSHSRISHLTYDLQFLREINLNSRRRPILLSPTIALGYQQLSRKIGNFESQNNFRINGKKFDSGSTDISLQQRGFRIAPSVSLGIEKSHQIQCFFSVGYHISMNSKAGLYFDETDQFFLRQKRAFLENGQDNLIIDSENELFNNRWMLSLGVYLSL